MFVLLGGFVIAYHHRHDVVDWATTFPGGLKWSLIVLAAASVVSATGATAIGLIYHYREAVGLRGLPARVASWCAAFAAWIVATTISAAMIDSFAGKYPSKCPDAGSLHCQLVELDWGWTGMVHIVYIVAVLAGPLSLVVWAEFRAARAEQTTRKGRNRR